jgi:hypothetical protein
MNADKHDVFDFVRVYKHATGANSFLLYVDSMDEFTRITSLYQELIDNGIIMDDIDDSIYDDFITCIVNNRESPSFIADALSASSILRDMAVDDYQRYGDDIGFWLPNTHVNGFHALGALMKAGYEHHESDDKTIRKARRIVHRYHKGGGYDNHCLYNVCEGLRKSLSSLSPSVIDLILHWMRLSLEMDDDGKSYPENTLMLDMSDEQLRDCTVVPHEFMMEDLLINDTAWMHPSGWNGGRMLKRTSALLIGR